MTRRMLGSRLGDLSASVGRPLLYWPTPEPRPSLRSLRALGVIWSADRRARERLAGSVTEEDRATPDPSSLAA